MAGQRGRSQSHRARCTKYRASNIREKNKVVKITKHLLKHPSDKQSKDRLNALNNLLL